MGYNLKKSKLLGGINLTTNKLPVKELTFYDKIQHRRLKVFYAQGTKCVCCPRIGTKLLVVDLSCGGGIHIDVFTEDDVLMTIDHIIPLSKGGKRTEISNLQIMCSDCNTKKSNKVW
ncbi:MAG: HNH endonuclease [Candidatus Saccharimonadaceae bacterium]